MAQVNEQQVGKILDYMRERNIFPGVRRISRPFDMEWALSAVDVIGKSRSPKFVIDDENRFVYENIIRWLYADDKMQCVDPDDHSRKIAGDINKGIFIAGGTGTGKSWCVDIMCAFSKVVGISTEIGGDTFRLTWGNKRADTIATEYQTTGDYVGYANSAILCINDLGSEQTETVYMGNRLNVMRAILEYRGDKTDAITIITSNIPMQHRIFVEKYGDRVASRMREMCNYFELTGKDRRKL